MEPSQKNLVYRVARAYLEVEEPEAVEELDEDFEFTLSEVERQLAAGPQRKVATSGRLRIDSLFAQADAIAWVICIATQVVLEIGRLRRDQDQRQRLGELKAELLKRSDPGSRIEPLFAALEQTLEELRDRSRVPAPSRDQVGDRKLTVSSVHTDLELLIRRTRSGDWTTFSLELNAPDPELEIHHRVFGPIELKRDPADYFAKLFEEIQALPADEVSPAEIGQEIADLGSMLRQQLVPEPLAALLAALGSDRKRRAMTLQIQSDEPWLPWELIRLPGCGQAGGGSFLCEAFAVARWLPETPPHHNLPLSRLAVVVPEDSNLAAVAEEVAYLESLRREEREVVRIPANKTSVRQAFALGIYDAWHFSGHGLSRADPNRSELLLEDSNRLTPRNLTGRAQQLGRAHPLVFLNACHTGVSGLSLTGVGGWAKQFLAAGAAAVLGTYWAIEDDKAPRFAKALYDALLGGTPLAEAVRQARFIIRTPDDPSWLAYTLLAHPLAAHRKISSQPTPDGSVSGSQAATS